MQPNHLTARRYFNDLVSTVQEPSAPLQPGDYYEGRDDEKITEIHQEENSKACQMVNLNIKHKV
jgi:hypothetical protein